MHSKTLVVHRQISTQPVDPLDTSMSGCEKFMVIDGAVCFTYEPDKRCSECGQRMHQELPAYITKIYRPKEAQRQLAFRQINMKLAADRGEEVEVESPFHRIVHWGSSW